METTTCTHQENIETLPHGQSRGICRICKQVRIYDMDARKPTVIVELGEIDGKVIIPNAGEKLQLSVADMAKLDAARKASTSPLKEKVVAAEAQPVPKKVKRGSWKERRQDLEQCKDAIISDYYSMKLKDFFKKWHMSTSTWHKLRVAWKVEEKHLATVRPHSDVVAQLSDDGLPPFPQFNNDWSMLVQIEWFRTYQALKRWLAEQRTER